MTNLEQKKALYDSIREYRKTLEVDWVIADKKLQKLEEQLEEEIDKMEVNYV